MKPDDFQYEAFKPLLKPYEAKKRAEGVSLLNWFLENIFRMEAVEADDAICDRPNDKGIDALYVDHTQEQILVLQGKLKQREGGIGDAPLRELVGTITQIETEEAVQALLDGGANEELKRVLDRLSVKGLISKGYKVVGLFVSNQPLDANGHEFLKGYDNLLVYDRQKLAREYIDIDAEGGVNKRFEFDASYVAPIQLKNSNDVDTFILPVQAIELVRMDGIDDGSLFSQNVRQSLGNTKVNKALRQSISDNSEHPNFILYHNGVTILCEEAELREDKIVISNYVVVNGAQSITTFKRSIDQLSPDLRIMAKIIKLADSSLAKRITVNSNNQNAIKPRDLKSNNEVQLRLKQQFVHAEDGRYEFEIKRGEIARTGAEVITNEEAGRLLLAFDLMQPESCHQVYKLFDDKYSDIFARREVNAHRIIFLHRIMERIYIAIENVDYKPLSKYGLTRFFMLSVVSEMMRDDEVARGYFTSPDKLFEEGWIEAFLDCVSEALSAIVIDLNYEVKEAGDTFDYKGDLKSPSKIKDLRSKLLRSFAKDVSRGKTETIGHMLANKLTERSAESGRE